MNETPKNPNNDKRPPRREAPPPRGPGALRGYAKPQNTKRVLLRLLSYLKGRQLLLLAVVILMLLGTAASLAGNYLLKPLINDYILPGNFPGLARMLLVLAGIHLTGVVATYAQNRLMTEIAQRTSNAMRRDLFAKLQSLPLSYFDAHPHGELMSRFTNDIDAVQMAFEMSTIQLISSTLRLMGALVLMTLLSPILILVTLTILALMVLVMRQVGSRSRRYFQAQQQDLGEVNGFVEEMIEGLKVVKVFSHEPQAMAEFRELNETYRMSAANANFYASVAMPIVGNLGNISYAASAVIGGLLAVAGRFDLGSLAAYLQYSRQVAWPVQTISNQFNTVLAALAGAERVFDVMDETPEMDAGRIELVGMVRQADGSFTPSRNGTHPTHWAWETPQPDGTFAYTELRGDVRLYDVTFGYTDDQTVLHDVSLYAKPCQKIAFVGSTGAGKTTIANLINRFYEINAGSIVIDGIDAREIRNDSLRNAIGMVLQDTHLFSGTVMDNIRYGRLDASDEACIQAAIQANADSFIRRLPQGYQTEITADGTNLSQGQRQLLAIARVAVADPPVMILDEATSSIDTRTERLIEKGLDALMQDRTVFVIAHRLSTVRNANAILVIEDGRIIERGDHDDLLTQRGRYYQLYTGQYELS